MSEERRPGKVISNWLRHLTVVRDCLMLSEAALNYGQHDASNLIELLLNPHRELPASAERRHLSVSALRASASEVPWNVRWRLVLLVSNRGWGGLLGVVVCCFVSCPRGPLRHWGRQRKRQRDAATQRRLGERLRWEG